MIERSPNSAISPVSGTDFTPVIAPHTSRQYTLKAKMNADAADACKSVTFTVPLNAQLVSAAS